MIERRPVPKRGCDRRDDIVFLYKLARAELDLFPRCIEVYDEEHQRVLVFLTSHRHCVFIIAATYTQCWQIELLFKTLKQTLRIKPSSSPVCLILNRTFLIIASLGALRPELTGFH